MELIPRGMTIYQTRGAIPSGYPYTLEGRIDIGTAVYTPLLIGSRMPHTSNTYTVIQMGEKYQ